MSKSNNNKLPNNLPQLQNLIKRDPESYKDEVDIYFDKSEISLTHIFGLTHFVVQHQLLDL